MLKKKKNDNNNMPPRLITMVILMAGYKSLYCIVLYNLFKSNSCHCDGDDPLAYANGGI